MEKIANELFLPIHFFEVSLNNIKNLYPTIPESVLEEEYRHVIEIHLKNAPYSYFDLLKFNDTYFILNPKKKDTFYHELAKYTKKENSYLIPISNLVQIQLFLLQMDQMKFMKWLYHAKYYNTHKMAQQIITEIIPYFNKPISSKCIINLIQNIANSYNKRNLYKHSASIYDLLVYISNTYFIQNEEGCIEIFADYQRYWTRSILVCPNKDVTTTKRYQYAKNYSPFHNPYFIKISPDHHIALLEHSSFTGD